MRRTLASLAILLFTACSNSVYVHPPSPPREAEKSCSYLAIKPNVNTGIIDPKDHPYTFGVQVCIPYCHVVGAGNNEEQVVATLIAQSDALLSKSVKDILQIAYGQSRTNYHFDGTTGDFLQRRNGHDYICAFSAVPLNEIYFNMMN